MCDTTEAEVQKTGVSWVAIDGPQQGSRLPPVEHLRVHSDFHAFVVFWADNPLETISANIARFA